MGAYPVMSHTTPYGNLSAAARAHSLRAFALVMVHALFMRGYWTAYVAVPLFVQWWCCVRQVYWAGRHGQLRRAEERAAGRLDVWLCR